MPRVSARSSSASGLGRTSRWSRGATSREPSSSRAVGAPPIVPMRADVPEDLLYLLYTSGTTAKPRIAVHDRGLPGRRRLDHHYVFDLKPDTDVYWCAADIGWVTGAATSSTGALQRRDKRPLRGDAGLPGQGPLVGHRRRYKVPILYTAPTAIRAHMKWGRARGEARPLVATPARDRRGADQLGGVGLVPSTSAATRRRSSTPGGRPRRG